MGNGGEAEERIEKGVAGDDVRVSDKSLSSFTVAFSISGSLRRSPELERQRKREKKRKKKTKKIQRGIDARHLRKKGRIFLTKIPQGRVRYIRRV